jgi:hypothetical protein
MRWVLVLLAAAGCFAPAQYAVDRPGLECERALRVARRTLDTLGYTITEMQEPKGERSPGVIAGTRTMPDGRVTTGRVRIKCGPGGAGLQPIEDSLVPNYEFSRAFGYSFKSLVQRPDVETPMLASGLQVLVESIDVYRQRLDLGGEAVRGGHVLVRLTVRNATDRRVALDASGITLAPAGGGTSAPLSGPAATATLAATAGGDRVRRELLDRVEVPADSTAVRFLIFPPGTYRDARVNVEDVETEEMDGFVTAVQ